MCAQSSSQVLVVIIAHHIVAQVSLVRVISWSSHDERISSTLSPPFPSTSSSFHSSLTSCTSSCTSSTTLRAVATLRTSPERRWTPLTTPTSSQKMEDAPKLLKNPKSECPDIWIRLPRHKWPKSWSSLEDPVVPLERNLYGHPLAGLLWERQFEKIQLKHGWEKVSNWECLFVHREKGLFLSVYVDDIKLAGKKQNIDPMWIVLNEVVDLGEPTSFLDHVYLGCTQRQCEISKDSVDTKACDKRLNRLISYIHHTCEYRQYCPVGNTAKQCRLGLFSRLRFCRRS